MIIYCYMNELTYSQVFLYFLFLSANFISVKYKVAEKKRETPSI